MTVQCTLLQVRLSWCGMQALSVGKHMFRSFNRRLRLWCWFKSHALAFCVGHSMTRPSARHSQRSMRNWAMQGQSLMSWIGTFWVPCKQFPHVSKTSSLQTRLACIRSRISVYTVATLAECCFVSALFLSLSQVWTFCVKWQGTSKDNQIPVPLCERLQEFLPNRRRCSAFYLSLSDQRPRCCPHWMHRDAQMSHSLTHLTPRIKRYQETTSSNPLLYSWDQLSRNLPFSFAPPFPSFSTSIMWKIRVRHKAVDFARVSHWAYYHSDLRFAVRQWTN